MPEPTPEEFGCLHCGGDERSPYELTPMPWFTEAVMWWVNNPAGEYIGMLGHYGNVGMSWVAFRSVNDVGLRFPTKEAALDYLEGRLI